MVGFGVRKSIKRLTRGCPNVSSCLCQSCHEYAEPAVRGAEIPRCRFHKTWRRLVDYRGRLARLREVVAPRRALRLHARARQSVRVGLWEELWEFGKRLAQRRRVEGDA